MFIIWAYMITGVKNYTYTLRGGKKVKKSRKHRNLNSKTFFKKVAKR